MWRGLFWVPFFSQDSVISVVNAVPPSVQRVCHWWMADLLCPLDWCWCNSANCCCSNWSRLKILPPDMQGVGADSSYWGLTYASFFLACDLILIVRRKLIFCLILGSWWKGDEACAGDRWCSAYWHQQPQPWYEILLVLTLYSNWVNICYVKYDVHILEILTHHVCIFLSQEFSLVWCDWVVFLLCQKIFMMQKHL